MPQPASFMSVILGSAVVSAAVSIGYNHFFVSKKDLLERELNFVSTLNTVLNDQDERDELGRLTFVTNVLHPLYSDDEEFSVVIEYFMRAKSDTADEASGQKGNTLDRVLTRGSEPLASPSVLATLAENDRIPSDYTTSNIRDSFFSGYRRQFSDKLVADINGGESGIPKVLIDAIISDDPEREYRVNLYIAYTLARSTSWTASGEDFSKFSALKSTSNYQDPTFREHVDTAIEKYSG